MEPVEKKTLAGFGAVAVVLALAYANAYDVHSRIVGVHRSISAGQDTVAALKGTLTEIVDAETGQRGYVITGRDEYLAPFDAAKKVIRAHVEAMRPVLAKSPQGESDFRELEGHIDAKLLELEETVALRRNGGVEAARQVVMSDRGHREMAAIRRLVATFEERLRAQISGHQAALERDVGTWKATFAFRVVVILGLFVGLFVVLSRDVRARRLANALVRESEDRFRLLVEGLKDTAIFMVSGEGAVKSWNLGAERLLGMRADEIVGKPLAALYSARARDAGAPERDLLEAATSGHASAEGVRVRKDGSPFAAEVALTRMPETRGARAGFVCVTRDVTYRKRLEDENDRFFTLSLDLLCIASVDGYFRRLNPAFGILGYSDEELLAKPFMEFVHPADRAKTAAELASLGRGVATIHLENRYRCKDGSYRWLNWTASPDASGTIYAAAHDITERKAADAELRQSEQSLAATLRSIADAVIACDTAGNITRMNPVAERLTGWPWAEAKGRPLGDVFRLPTEAGGDATARFERKLRDATFGDSPRQTRLLAKDGSERFVSDTASPIRGESGEVTGIVVVFRDVTAERAAQRAMVRAQEELRELVDKLPDCIAIRKGGRLVYANEALLSALGHRIEEMRGARAIDQIHPDDRERVLDRVQRHPGEALGEVRLRHPDGHDVFLDVASQVPVTFEGAPALLMPARDITKTKGAQLALRESEERFRALATAAPVGIFQADAEGRPLYANETLKRLAGLSFAEGATADFFALIVPADKARVDERWAACVREVRGFSEELRLVAPNDDARWVRAQAMPLVSPEGICTGWVGTVEDIHERRMTQEALERAKELAEATSRSKSEFLANMSHEIRTPMNGILGMADLLGETALTEEQSEYVDAMRTAGDHLLNIINDILDLSKVEAGHLELEAIPFELRAVVEETAQLVDARRAQRGLDLRVDIADDVPKTLIGDPNRIRQVLVNLIGNAIKFTERGEITLRIARDAEPPGPGALRVSVADTGIGIPADKLVSIFDIFTQVDASTTRNYGGSGLGLSIVSRLVALMGGRIWVESELGKGSTFHFTMRLGAHDEKVEELNRAAATALVGERTLVLDDDMINRMILREMLLAWGALPTLVATPDEMYAELSRARDSGEPYGLLLLDARPGDTDALDVAAHVRRELGDADVAIVILRSGGAAPDGARVADVAIAAVVQKPVRRAQMWNAITRALRRDRLSVAPHESASLTALRVLLVEDAEDNRLLVQSYLRGTGCELDLAENGQVALEKFAPEKYAIILMDMQMPIKDGYLATREIRDRERDAGAEPTPIIALTAHALREDTQRSLAAGCTHHLTKPIRKADLIQALRRFARRDESTEAKIEVRIDPDLAHLAAGFLKNRDEDIETLTRALAERDFETVRIVGHSLKGTASNYGFDDLARLGARLEAAGRAKNEAPIARELEAMRSYLRRVHVVGA